MGALFLHCRHHRFWPFLFTQNLLLYIYRVPFLNHHLLELHPPIVTAEFLFSNQYKVTQSTYLYTVFLDFLEYKELGSMSSSANKFVASKGAIQEPEESGWTQYLEEFSSEQRENSAYSYDDDHSFGSPSLVSDAASPANNSAWNFSGNREVFASAAMGAAAPQFPKRLNMKKQRYQGYSCDDLEDTASSPANSPKVSSLKQMEMTYRRTDDGLRNFLDRDGGSDQLPRRRTDERSRINLDGKKTDYDELKKRGLCLMPFSMLVRYMG